MNSKLHQIVPLGTLTLLAISLGCRAHSDLAAIKGQVKFKNGEAIDRGTIEFDRIDSKAAFQSGARIGNGTYEIPRDKGLRAGKYVVRIYAPSSLLSPQGAPGGAGTPAPGGGGKASQLPEERVSSKFNSESKLVVEVTGNATQTFDFEVE